MASNSNTTSSGEVPTSYKALSQLSIPHSPRTKTKTETKSTTAADTTTTTATSPTGTAPPQTDTTQDQHENDPKNQHETLHETQPKTQHANDPKNQPSNQPENQNDQNQAYYDALPINVRPDVTPASPAHEQPVIGLIGMGAMGRMYARALGAAGWVRINVCDLPEKYESLKKEYADNPHITPLPDGHAVSRSSDFIVYSVEAEFISRVVQAYGPSTKVHAVVAGQTSVKAPEKEAFERFLPRDVHVVSCHSLHGPGVGTEGQPLIIIRHRSSPAAQTLVESILRPLKSRHVHLSYAEHDVITASTQAVTHAAFLSMGSAWSAAKSYPWEEGWYVGGIETAKVNLTLRIYSNSWHVYAGLAILNPEGKRGIERYAQSAGELFKLMLAAGGDGFGSGDPAQPGGGSARAEARKRFRERVEWARDVVFGNGRFVDGEGKAGGRERKRRRPILLSEDVLDRFSLGKLPEGAPEGEGGGGGGGGVGGGRGEQQQQRGWYKPCGGPRAGCCPPASPVEVEEEEHPAAAARISTPKARLSTDKSASTSSALLPAPSPTPLLSPTPTPSPSQPQPQPQPSPPSPSPSPTPSPASPTHPPSKYRPNSHLSLLAMVDCWAHLGINPYEHLELAATPLFRLFLGVAEWLFLAPAASTGGGGGGGEGEGNGVGKGKGDGNGKGTTMTMTMTPLAHAIHSALYDTWHRSDDLEFVIAARGWSQAVSFGSFEVYKRRFEETRGWFEREGRFADGEVQRVGNEMIKAVMESEVLREEEEGIAVRGGSGGGGGGG